MNNNHLLDVNVTFFEEHERLKLIRSAIVPQSVLEYLKIRLKNLTIEILGKHSGNIIELMNRGLLEGWCWQTTESAIVFFNDEDTIERGYLKFSKYKDYWHSWICFKYENQQFVFDPCLQILVEKPVYYHIFETTINGMVTSKKVVDELIYKINNPEKIVYLSDESEKFIKNFFEKFASERKKKETHIHGGENVNFPMYRNNTGYIATMEEGKIKELIAHYY